VEKLIFRLCALGFLAGAAYHISALVAPGAPWLEPSPPWRHALFVAVNLAGAAGFWTRPRWLVFPVAALAAQQVVSHGLYGWAVWRDERRVDRASVLVLLAMPALVALLARGHREAPRRVTPAAPEAAPR
jgi:hypothetical protein